MQSLSEQLISFLPNSIKVLASKGEWSLHNLLPIILSHTGPAKVSITSFSLSEEAVRSFLHLKENNLMVELNCLFDFTMRNHKIDLMLFLANVADEIRTAPNHSKIMLIENNGWQIAIITSANLTPNPRLEVTTIFINHENFIDFKNIFNSAWTSAIPYT